MAERNDSSRSDDDKLVQSLMSFVSGAKFQGDFERFFLEHCRSFDLESEEHSLEYTPIYNLFIDMFEQSITEFCQSENITKNEFYNRCREATSTDVRVSQYLQVMLHSCEFTEFVKLMKVMRNLHGERLKCEEEQMELLEDNLRSEKKKKKTFSEGGALGSSGEKGTSDVEAKAAPDMGRMEECKGSSENSYNSGAIADAKSDD